jgi:hypothetical protein
VEIATALQQKAVDKTGLTDFGDPYFETTLAAWCEDLADGRLTETGKAAFASQMIGDLARRLRIIDCLKQHPEIEDVAIPPILYISGLERTGTTFLHNLLGLDPKARALKRWELMSPVPPPEAATYLTDSRITRTQASIDKLRGTLLEQMHWVDADDPEECAWALIDGSSIMGGAASVAMPRWRAQLAVRDIRRAFTEYRSIIKLLLWKNPVPPGGHLVLKSPQFLESMPVFLEVFPEARLIWTHRDPFRAIVSGCTMMASLHQPLLVEQSALTETSLLPDIFGGAAELRLAAMTHFCAGRNDVTHVAYPEFVGNPIPTVGSIYQDCGVSAPDDLDARMARFIADQRAGKRAAPPATIPNFGLDHDEFLGREAIAAYCRQFGVEPERSRQTGI